VFYVVVRRFLGKKVAAAPELAHEPIAAPAE
jgi:hypothetical protein